MEAGEIFFGQSTHAYGRAGDGKTAGREVVGFVFVFETVSSRNPNTNTNTNTIHTASRSFRPRVPASSPLCPSSP